MLDGFRVTHRVSEDRPDSFSISLFSLVTSCLSCSTEVFRFSDFGIVALLIVTGSGQRVKNDQ